MESKGGADAVLNLSTDSSSPISVRYGSSFGDHDGSLLLLEIDPNLIPEIINQRVVIRGDLNEEAVLCTSSETYALKFVSTSNTVFLVPPNDPSGVDFETEAELGKSVSIASVAKVSPGHMEIIRVAPKLEKLTTLLKQRVYRVDSDLKENFGLYTWEDLIEKIQASEGELRGGLRALSAIEIDGYWRILDDELIEELLVGLFRNSVISGWSWKALNEEEAVQVMVNDGYSSNLVRHILQIYGSKEEKDGDFVWCMDERKVCVFHAKRILAGGRKRKLQEFLLEWAQRAPNGMSPKMEFLEGEILTEKLGFDSWIYGFSVSSLPMTAAARFAAIFKERQKWEWQDLEPYVRDLHVPGLSSEALLIKYSRRIQRASDAVSIYSAR